MRLARKGPSFKAIEEEFPEQDLDIYSDELDAEDLIDRGMSPGEAGFVVGFRGNWRKFN